MSDTGELLNELLEGINESYRLSKKSLARIDELERALKPFAQLACDPVFAPCQCTNCEARRVLGGEL